MSSKTRLLAILAALLILAGAASAEGAGGTFFQIVKPDWNPSFLPGAQMPYAIDYFGGYGYGVTNDGAIIGGFGIGFLDSGTMGIDPSWSSKHHIAGGVGGVLVGARLVGTRFMHLDLASRLGLGGLWYYNPTGTWRNNGYAIVYAEPYAELGVGFTSWMHLSVTLGYTVMANIVPGLAFEDFVNNSPTLGFTLTFGNFERPW